MINIYIYIYIEYKETDNTLVSNASHHLGRLNSKSSITQEEIRTLKLKKVAGDGSCAFRSLAQG